MANRVVMHIGTMKSGTTYLQRVLGSGALESSATEAFYAGGSFGAQAAAVRGMMGARARRRRQIWDQLAEQVQRREGVAVYSHEFLSFAGRRSVRDLVASFDGTPVEVVVTVRDQHRAIPAQWQSYTRNRGTDDWASYVRRLIRMATGDGDATRVERSYRRAQDVARIMRRWTGHEAVSGLTVVVVPAPGTDPAELWRRFCTAARIPAGAVPQATIRANESLGYASCDVLRRLNGDFADLEKHHFRRIRENLLDALLPLRTQEERPQLDRKGAELARDLNGELVAAVVDSGVRVVGSLREIPRDDPDTSVPDSIPPPDPGEVRRALAAAWKICDPDGEPPPDLDVAIASLARRLVERHR